MSEVLTLIRIVLNSKSWNRTKQDLVVSANKIFYRIDVLLKMSLKLSFPEPSNILNTGTCSLKESVIHLFKQ